MKFRWAFLFVILFFHPLLGFAKIPGNVTIKSNLNIVMQQSKYVYVPLDLEKKKGRPSWVSKLGEGLVNLFIVSFRAMGYFSIVLAVAILLLILFLVYILLKRNMQPGARIFEAKRPDPMGHTLDHERHLADAERLISSGELRQSVELILTALWLGLHAKELLRYRKATTNREYVRQLAGSGYAQQVDQVVSKAEAAVFGKDDLDETVCRGLHSEVCRLVT